MAKREKSDILSGMGTGFQILKRLRDGCNNDRNLRRLLKDDGCFQRVVEILNEEDGVIDVQRSFGFPTSYDQSNGLRKLIELAVGEQNIRNINNNITQERFPLAGTGVRKLNLRVEPYLHGETSELAALRLMVAGHVPANTGDLAGFLREHPTEVEKWNWVSAISADSWWTDSDGYVYVPCANVDGAYRNFYLCDLRSRLRSGCGVLVVCE